MEEQTTFCPACGAPQIKVTPKSAADQPSTLPLPPGTPASIEPPALPLHFAHPAPIEWKKFLRSALPLCVLAGLGLAYTGLIGVIIFFGLVAIMVVRYQRQHPAPLSGSQGARMGALAGVLSFFVVLIVVAFSVLQNPGELQRQLVTAMNQRFANNPDPHAQQFAQWATSTEGLVVFLVLATIITLIFFVILASAVGAIAASLSGSRQRR